MNKIIIISTILLLFLVQLLLVESKFTIVNKNYNRNTPNFYHVKSDDPSIDLIQYVTIGSLRVNVESTGTIKDIPCNLFTNSASQVVFSCNQITDVLSTVHSKFIFSATLGTTTTVELDIRQFYFQDATQIGYTFTIIGEAISSIDKSLLKIVNQDNGNFEMAIKDVTSTTIAFSADKSQFKPTSTYTIMYNGEIVKQTTISIVPSITSTEPSYLINDGDDLIINAIGLSETVSDNQVFIFSNSDSVWSIAQPFTMLNAGQIKLDNATLYPFYGEVLLRILVAPTQYSNNYGTVGFAKGIINNLTQNRTSLVMNVDGKFLNSTQCTYMLKGFVSQPHPSIGLDNTGQMRLKFDGSVMQFVRSAAYVQCDQSKSNKWINYPVGMQSVDYFHPIERKGGVFHFSGQVLIPTNEDNELLYKITIGNGVVTIPCENITIVNYVGNQLYNATCLINDYVEPSIYSIRTFSTEASQPMGDGQRNIFQYLPPSITNSTSTWYGTPSEIKITGLSFCMLPIVTLKNSLGNTSVCVVRLSDWENGIIYCMFNSDLSGQTETFSISVQCETQIGKGDVFIYSVDECEISKSFNGQVCSGNGTCNEFVRKCVCNDNYQGLDCSIYNNGSSNVNPPKLDNTTSIIEIDNSKFEIGIVQIRENGVIDNSIVRVYNLSNVSWKLDQELKSDTDLIYNVTLDNGSLLKAHLTVNTDTKQSKQYDFYGDIVTILPNSVKYQIEISNWSFASNLNTLELIFQSQLSNQQCNDNGNTSLLVGKQNIQLYGDSIRSVELTLKNGQTLIGTFSNRMKLDDTIVKSTIKVLSTEESIGLPSIKPTTTSTQSSSDNSKIITSIQNVYTSVLIGHFKNLATIDPNFGVLINSDLSGSTTNIDECGNVIGTSSKFASWKIALIVVLVTVGIACIVAGAIIYKTRNRNTLMVNGVKLSMKGNNSKP